MTVRNQPKKTPWIIASTFALLATSTLPGCKSNSIQPQQHGATAISAPTTSSAVGDLPASGGIQKSVSDYYGKHSNEAYADVNQLATKAANDLKTGAQQAQTDVVQGVKEKAAGYGKQASQSAQNIQTSVDAQAQQATDSVSNAVDPKAAVQPPVVLPDPSTGQP